FAFEQAHTPVPHSGAGLGLGLTICKTLVDMHGGRLRVRSEGLGKGSVFTVELECCNTPPEEARVPPTSADNTASGEKKLRLLIVDDHADTARAMARLLSRLGYETTCAG